MRTFVLVLALASPAGFAQSGVWTGFGDGADGFVNDLATSETGTVYMAGDFETVAGISTGPVASWDGDTWRPTGPLAGAIRAVAAGPDGAIIAAGSLTELVPDRWLCAARWTGSGWSAIGTQCGVGLSAYDVAVLPDGSPVIGGRDVESAPAVLRWTGSEWADMGAGAPLFGNVWALVVGPDGDLYAGGEFLRRSQVPAEGCVARWDGTAWTMLGTNLRPASSFGECVFSLAVALDGAVYAGGFFTVGDDPAIRNVARWDGMEWTALSSPFDGPTVWALRFAPDGRLYAARYGVDTLTSWDGASWTLVGYSNGGAFGLAVDADGQILVGGGFDHIAGVASPNVARYAPTPVSSEPPPADTPFAVYPNPTTGPATIRTATGGRAEILDALGRVLWAGTVALGATDLPTAGLAPGVYVVRLVAVDATSSQRLVVGR